VVTTNATNWTADIRPHLKPADEARFSDEIPLEGIQLEQSRMLLVKRLQDFRLDNGAVDQFIDPAWLLSQFKAQHSIGVRHLLLRMGAKELVALGPDVILAHGTSTVGPLLQLTRSIPIVFPVISDPIAAGYVESLARPGGNATGFMTAEYSVNGKYLELLKDIAPGITRVAVLRDASQGAATGQFAVIHAMAPLLRVQVNPINLRETRETAMAVKALSP